MSLASIPKIDAGPVAKPARSGFAKQPSLRDAAIFSALMAVVGALASLSTSYALWDMWKSDPLKSLGAFIPIVSIILILRVWRSLDWEMNGSWWGLALLAATIGLVHLRDQTILELLLTPSWSMNLPPYSLVAVCYAGGVVLLFGGKKLLRAARFPVLLMWFVNPIPRIFVTHIDLPLQHASALVARSFAHLLGEKLTPDQLRLMFTPDFGMFIAPGCDGIRGAITMGFIALIAGYVFRFRPRSLFAVTAGAVLLGYIFNFLRLCCLVVYYVVALHLPWLQDRAEMGDYIIGAILFFIAAFLLLAAVQRLNHEKTPIPEEIPNTPYKANFARLPKSFAPRALAFAILIGLGSISYARSFVELHGKTRATRDPKLPGFFPAHVGRYTLTREWNENLVTGALIYHWGDYAVQDTAGRSMPGTAVVSVGSSPVLGAHDTLPCHEARGEQWLWHGTSSMKTGGGDVDFSSSFFNDGAIQYMEAATLCSAGKCGQSSRNGPHFAFVYSRPNTSALLYQSAARPIPLLLHTETLDTTLMPDKARALLTDQLRDFLSVADLSVFTEQYRDESR